ncbi:hypothetical protein QR685DRAFT_54061 [Neurospora intermedia]|uniref:Uncharacterized protein n=1 Tax=Neurospora intermedia TaxID=5142 RepID=A0ABR3DUP4_NEUIN
MKLSTVAPFLLCSVHTALAQSLAPSPTASVGCEPHGDHWHCKGPKVTSLATAVTAASVSSVAATTSAVHDHDDHDHDEEDHDHDGESASSVSLKPSPTESYGCEAHGDHWHCAGHVSATSTTSPGSQEQASSGNATAPTTPPTAGAVRQGASGLAAAGLAIMALAF